MNNRKKWELAILEYFKRIYCDFPKGNILPSEEPDFLVNSNGRTIGIELVDFLRDASKSGSRQKERVKEKIGTEVIFTKEAGSIN